MNPEHSSREWIPLHLGPKLGVWFSSDDGVGSSDGCVRHWNNGAPKPRKRYTTVTGRMRAEMRKRRPFETSAAIAADLGVAESTVRYYTKDIRRPRPDMDRAIALLRLGATRQETARRLGISVVTLWTHLKRAGIQPSSRFSDVAPRRIAP